MILEHHRDNHRDRDTGIHYDTIINYTIKARLAFIVVCSQTHRLGNNIQPHSVL